MATILDALNLFQSEQQEMDQKAIEGEGVLDLVPFMEEKIAHLEKNLEDQWKFILILLEFCRSAANKEGMSLLSFQQLYSPSSESCGKVRALFEEIRKK